MTDELVVIQGTGDGLMEMMSLPTPTGVGASGDGATGGAYRCWGYRWCMQVWSTHHGGGVQTFWCGGESGTPPPAPSEMRWCMGRLEKRRTHTQTHTRAHTHHIHTHAHTCTHARPHTHTHTHTHVEDNYKLMQFINWNPTLHLQLHMIT